MAHRRGAQVASDLLRRSGPAASAAALRQRSPLQIIWIARGDADDARQPLRAAGTGDDAQRHLRQTHHVPGGRDARVAAERQLEAAAERGAVQRGDDGLPQASIAAITAGSWGSAERLAELAKVRARQ